MGSLYHFLDIEVHRDGTGMFLTQSRYIKDLLQKAEMGNAKACSMPLATGENLSKEEG